MNVIGRIVAVFLVVGVLLTLLAILRGRFDGAAALAVACLTLALTTTVWAAINRKRTHMSTTARKARKRAGIPFQKTPKTPTPVENRSSTERAINRMIARIKRALRAAGKPVTEENIEAALREEAGR